MLGPTLIGLQMWGKHACIGNIRPQMRASSAAHANRPPHGAGHRTYASRGRSSLARSPPCMEHAMGASCRGDTYPAAPCASCEVRFLKSGKGDERGESEKTGCGNRPGRTARNGRKECRKRVRKETSRVGQRERALSARSADRSKPAAAGRGLFGIPRRFHLLSTIHHPTVAVQVPLSTVHLPLLVAVFDVLPSSRIFLSPLVAHSTLSVPGRLALVSTPLTTPSPRNQIHPMDPFGGIGGYWDMSQQPDSFSSLPDDDFLAFLEKQFPIAITNPAPHLDPAAPIPVSVPEVIDPQHLTRFPSNSTPTSSESSPSPPSLQNESSPSRRQSGVFSHAHSTSATAEPEDARLKRKASSDSVADEPTHKSQHITNPGTSKKSTASARRKSTGNPTQDESRLLKRKEQNRAAQRAFRERKEKHVKDLEDKVAALEAKNQMTETENENLRDLLSRLQNENMMLKQAAFTFQMPRDTSTNNVSSFNGGPNQFNFSTPGAGPSKVPLTPLHSPQPPFNFGSLISFDPNMLNMNDEPAPAEGSMGMDYGFGQPNVPYKTIASNPMFMSFAEPSPYDSTPQIPGNGTGNGNGNGTNHFNNMTSFDHWTPPDPSSLDQLFGGNYLGTTQNGVAFEALLASPPSSLSPVSHAARSAASSSPLSSGSSAKSTSISTPGNATSPAGSAGTCDGDCPRTKEDLRGFIADQGSSQFACDMPMTPFLRKANSDEGSQMIMCEGSSFPSTEKSDKNVEVLAAWRSITSNPQFKDLDINELCSEFTKKARCDGTKVVLEPQGVHCIIEALAAKRQQQQLKQ